MYKNKGEKEIEAYRFWRMCIVMRIFNVQYCNEFQEPGLLKIPLEGFQVSDLVIGL